MPAPVTSAVDPAEEAHPALGATLYVPATRDDLTAVANAVRWPGLRSLIFCTEDAVAPDSVARSVANLAAMLRALDPAGPRRFIRVRDAEVLARMLALDGIDRIDGFVLPKVTAARLPAYLDAVGGDPRFWLMPTLETPEAFDQAAMTALRAVLTDEGVRPRILCLRIGANDLMQCLGVRRSPLATIYETAIGPTIAMLAGTFRPYGFGLSGPVFEGLDHPEVLAREVSLDLGYGLMGKTAVHPAQVPIIERGYRVSADDVEAAERILAPDADAVFRLNAAMCEPATHRAWARSILIRRRLFGEVVPLGADAAARPLVAGAT